MMKFLKALGRMKRNFLWDRRSFEHRRHEQELFDNDEDLTNFLRKNKSKRGFSYHDDRAFPVAEYMHEDKVCLQTMQEVFADTIKFRLSHWDKDDFQNICQALRLTQGLNGAYVEIGTYTGSSANLALCFMKNIGVKRVCTFIDTFEGFNYEDAFKSFDNGFKGTHEIDDRDIIPFLQDLLTRYNISFHIVKSNICNDELPENIKEIAVCNIDVDLYEATRDALRKVADKIIQHGIIIVEDFGHTPALAGANLAVREFLESNKSFLPVYMQSGQIFLIRK